MILLSGGIDSTACIEYYKKNGFKIECLFVDFGQKSLRQEQNAVKKITKFYKVQYEKVKCIGYKSLPKGVIQGRNMFLISTALMYTKIKSGIIALGIHSGTDYVDCSQQFTSQINNLFDLYTGGKIILGAPFIQFNKAEVLQYCFEMKVPVELTYSCELGLKQPCNKCSSCKDLKKIYAS